jgi:hypothetical protein
MPCNKTGDLQLYEDRKENTRQGAIGATGVSVEIRIWHGVKTPLACIYSQTFGIEGQLVVHHASSMAWG